jgi:hypothetical protein
LVLFLAQRPAILGVDPGTRVKAKHGLFLHWERIECYTPALGDWLAQRNTTVAALARAVGTVEHLKSLNRIY